MEPVLVVMLFPQPASGPVGSANMMGIIESNKALPVFCV